MSKFIKARFRRNIHLKTKIKTLFSMRSYISILNLVSAQKIVIKLRISKLGYIISYSPSSMTSLIPLFNQSLISFLILLLDHKTP